MASEPERLTDSQAVQAIFVELDGRHWSAAHLDSIAEILRRTGRLIREPDTVDSLGETLPINEPCGPGKFEGQTDVEAWIYARTMHGGADQETSLPDGEGWWGLQHLDEEECLHLATLPAYRDEFYHHCIIHQDSNGFITVTWYTAEADAQKAFDSIETDNGNISDDCDEGE